MRPSYAATGLVSPSPPYVVTQTQVELVSWMNLHSDNDEASQESLHFSQSDIDALRRAGQVARSALELACSLADVGKSTDDIDAEVRRGPTIHYVSRCFFVSHLKCVVHVCGAQVHDAICAAGAYPAPLNYRGFPKSICSAVSERKGLSQVPLLRFYRPDSPKLSLCIGKPRGVPRDSLIPPP